VCVDVVDHHVGEVPVDVQMDGQIVASLSMTYVSAGPLLDDVSQVSLD